MRQTKSRGRLKRQKEKLASNNVVFVEATQEALDILVSKGYKYKPVKYTSFYEIILPKGVTLEQALAQFDEIGVNDSVEFDTQLIETSISTPDLSSPKYAGLTDSQLYYTSAYDVGSQGSFDGGVVGTTDNIWHYMEGLAKRRPLTPIVIGSVENGNVNGHALLSHPAFLGRLKLPEYPADQTVQLNAHATQTIGIMVAQASANSGVPGCGVTAKVWPMAIWGTAASFYSCIAQCIDNNVRVVNISQTGSESRPWLQITRVAKEQGMIICISAGNTSLGPGPNLLIADNPNVLSIAGTDTANDRLSTASVYDEWVNFFGPYSMFTVNSTGLPNPARVYGTSISSPFIAALFANIFSINPSLTWNDAVQIVARNCIPVRPPVSQPDMQMPYGCGLPQWRTTLRDVVAESPISGIYDHNKNLIRQMITPAEDEKLYTIGIYDENKEAIWRPTYSL